MVRIRIIAGVENRKLRVVTAAGGLAACCAVLAAAGTLLYKLMFWSSFDAGPAPLVIGLCFLGAVQLASVGIIGDYIHSAFAQQPRYARGAGRTGF